MPAITTEHLTVRYKNGVTALDDLTLRVEEGELFALLGPNGAGKSTLINVLTTCLCPTSGTAAVLGADVRLCPAQVRKRIACAAQNISVDLHLSLRENMLFQARLYHVEPAQAKTRMAELLRCFDLDSYQKRPVFAYSGGVKRRLDIAMRLISQPGVLFLDEPTAGLDLQSQLNLWESLYQIRRQLGTTIFLTTHSMEEADRQSDTVCILKDGRLVTQGSPEALRRYLRQEQQCVSFATVPEAEACAALLQRQLHLPANSQGTDVLFPGDSETLRRTAGFLLEQNMPFTAIGPARQSLEDVFLGLTAGKEAVQ